MNTYRVTAKSTGNLVVWRAFPVCWLKNDVEQWVKDVYGYEPNEVHIKLISNKALARRKN